MENHMSSRKRPWTESNEFSIPQLSRHRSGSSVANQMIVDQNPDPGLAQRQYPPAPPVPVMHQDSNRSSDVPNRKFTACDACRKQKIKCDMPNEFPPCVRCHRRGLQCILNKSLPSSIEDVRKMELLTKDLANIHQVLDEVCRHFELPVPKPLLSKGGAQLVETGSAANSGDEPDCEVSPPLSPSAVQAPIDTFLEVAKLGSPGSANQSLTHRKPYTQQDLVGKGIITIQVAEKLFDRYLHRLDHYLYGVSGMFEDLASVRNASPILFAAICTVSALHEPGPGQALYDSCNREFRRLVSRSLFEKRDIEFIRAMVIASFWLSDASRIFSANGIRRAADARLHRFFRLAVAPDQQHSLSPNLTQDEVVDRVRLWYLLFISDQHMSIMHNRDSLLRTDREITNNWEAFLERDDIHENDVRILSQASLLLIMGQARDALGLEPDERLALSMAGQLNNFSRQLDKWYNKFVVLFKPNKAIGGFPAKGLQLHHHFGKLHLGHHVFQGLRGDHVPRPFVSFALMAHDAARSIFDMIVNDQQLQDDLIGVPHYFHIMIAFAGHFLLEVCNKYSEQLSLDLNSDLGLISRALSLFEKMHCTPQHPIHRMTPGLGHKLYECAARMGVSLIEPIALQVQESNIDNIPFSSNVENFQFMPEHIHQLADPTLAHFGEFQFPDMSLNFMT